MVKKVSHIGIAVHDVDAALKVMEDVFGLRAEGIEVVESQKVRVAFVPVGEVRLELLEPTDEGSSVAKFLATRGEGIHHVALGTDDVKGALAAAEAGGARLIDKAPRPGAHNTQVGFVHPKSTLGVLFELVQELAKG